MLARLRSRLAARTDDSPQGRVWPAVAALLRTVAEAGWLTVLYAAAAVLTDKQAPVIGPLEMFGFVGAGVLIGIAGRKWPTPGALLLIGGVIAAAALGSLSGAQAVGVEGDWLAGLGVHFAGWLAGAAVLRGAVVSIGEKVAEQLEQLLRIVPVGLGVLWAYTTFAARSELWLPFAIAAMWGTGMYLSGSLIGIGMARLNVLHAEVTDVRQRRAWRWLVLAVGLGVVPLMVPLAVLAGIPLTALLSPVIGPIQWLLSLLAYPLALIIWVFSFALGPIAGPIAEFFNEWQRRVLAVPDRAGTYEVATILASVMVALTFLLIALAVFLTARWLLTRRSATITDAEGAAFDIERTIVLPEREDPIRAPRRRRRGVAHDAVEAYVSAIHALDLHGELARQPAETPAAHAARLRPIDRARGHDLARLAAAYQLARYGARTITQRENSRALDRLKRIRQALRAR